MQIEGTMNSNFRAGLKSTEAACIGSKDQGDSDDG